MTNLLIVKNKSRNGDEVDLHGLYVQEATERAEEAIARCQREGRDHLTIIVGRGNHSVGQHYYELSHLLAITNRL
jgi:DNA-nicking Smr family endonuclease